MCYAGSFFIASCWAVWKAWTSVYPTPVSSAFLLPLHRLYTRCPLRSFVLLSGSDCRRFFRVQHCIPEVRNSQCHRQSRTKSGGGGKWTCFSCRRFLLSAPVCIARRHLGRFLTRFCVLCLPFFASFL